MGARVGRGRWMAAVVVAAMGVVGASAPAQATSLSPRGYYDGNNAQTSHIYCVTSTPESMSAVWVGYYGTADVTWPRVGDVYYIHVWVYGLGSPCVGEGYVTPEFTLQPSTQILNNANYPVYCVKHHDTASALITTANGCPTAAEIISGGSFPGHGTYGLYARRAGPDNSSGWWALPTGYSIEFQVPVVSSAAMSGIATGSYLYGYVTDIGTSNWAGASQGVFVGPDDRIFLNGFNDGTMNSWTLGASSLGGGNLAVRSDSGANAPSFGGTSPYGMRANVTSTTPLYVADDSPNNAGRYRGRFFFNPGTFDPGEASAHFRAVLFLGFDLSPTQRRVMSVELKRQGGVYSVRASVRADSGARFSTSFVTISAGWHSLEFDFQRASAAGANNGTLRLWVDDGSPLTISGIDNDTAGVDRVRLGLMSPKSGASGLTYFDEFESRTTTAIGPYY